MHHVLYILSIPEVYIVERRNICDNQFLRTAHVANYNDRHCVWRICITSPSIVAQSKQFRKFCCLFIQIANQRMRKKSEMWTPLSRGKFQEYELDKAWECIMATVENEQDVGGPMMPLDSLLHGSGPHILPCHICWVFQWFGIGGSEMEGIFNWKKAFNTEE